VTEEHEASRISGLIAVSAKLGPNTILDLHELPEDGKSFELEDGWLVEVAASSRHNWVLQNLSRIVEDAAARAGSAVIVCEGREWEITPPPGSASPTSS
jgi:hypothetical protein